ncbi:MAG: hypothetical protein BEN19_01800 [Epulopiscium sp. Nuni2H_MBin003]|nr:MAG: hypothetical protein BEN19_01800 [Epulopiscium sp. Nuni2H_MBin003]
MKHIFINILISIIGVYIGVLIVNPIGNKFGYNTYLQNINISGMSYEEALLIEKEVVTLKYGNNFIEIPQTVPIDGILQKIVEDKPTVLQSLLNYVLNINMIYMPKIMIDENIILPYIEHMEEIVHQDIRVASIQVIEDSLQITEHNPLVTINVDALLEETISRFEVWDFTVIDVSKYLDIQKPSIDTKTISQIDTKIISIKTMVEPDSAEATNLNVATSKISNILLMPEEVFDYDKLIGDITQQQGFVLGNVRVKEKMIDMIGGGIGQLSSTLYTAILNLGLNPQERHSNTVAINYIPLGLDAAFSKDQLNLRFINTLSYPILINSYLEDDELTVDIYSNKALENIKYVITTDIIETTEPSTMYVYNQAQNNGVVTAGKNGYTVQVTRQQYIDKEPIGELELISIDKYAMQSNIYNIVH